MLGVVGLMLLNNYFIRRVEIPQPCLHQQRLTVETIVVSKTEQLKHILFLMQVYMGPHVLNSTGDCLCERDSGNGGVFGNVFGSLSDRLRLHFNSILPRLNDLLLRFPYYLLGISLPFVDNIEQITQLISSIVSLLKA